MSAVRHQMLFQRSLPGFEPSPQAYAPSLEFYRRATALCAKAGITTEADIDLFSALISRMAHQQVANDPAGHRWAGHAERAVDMLLAADRHPTTQPARQPTRRSPRPTT